jgi:hypothetical protein
MSSIMYHLVSGEGRQTLTVFLPGTHPRVIHDDHPNFDTIQGILKDNEWSPHEGDATRIVELADASLAVDNRLTPLSERVSVANGRVYFDGDEIDSAITDHIVRFLEEGVENWKALVNFLEKLAANPVEHTQHRLYGWLAARDFTITEDGDFIAYKGLTRERKSIHSGPAIVDGERINGQVPNEPGSTVEFERSEVEHNPAVGCSTGLHAGTWEFARGFSRAGVVVSVKVNPRDVVSVPTDSGDQKVRVCRYRVLEVVEEPTEAPLVSDEGFTLGD